MQKKKTENKSSTGSDRRGQKKKGWVNKGMKVKETLTTGEDRRCAEGRDGECEGKTPCCVCNTNTWLLSVCVCVCALQLRGGPRGRDATACRASPLWTVTARRRGRSVGGWGEAAPANQETWTSAGMRSSASPTTSGKTAVAFRLLFWVNWHLKYFERV